MKTRVVAVVTAVATNYPACLIMPQQLRRKKKKRKKHRRYEEEWKGARGEDCEEKDKVYNCAAWNLLLNEIIK